MGRERGRGREGEGEREREIAEDGGGERGGVQNVETVTSKLVVP